MFMYIHSLTSVFVEWVTVGSFAGSLWKLFKKKIG